MLKPGLEISPVPVTPSLYQQLDEEFNGFKGHVLISMYEFEDSWPTWEIHPHGDELVLLLSGEATMVLKTSNGEQSLALQAPGSYVIVPKNTWHTARVNQNCSLLFVTPGEGTENKTF